MSSYPQDNFEGVLRPRLVVDADQLIGIHQGGVHVQPGATLSLNGTMQGSLAIEDGAVVELAGILQGSLHVDQGGSALATGAVQGSTTNFGSVVVEQTGTAAGSVHNEGLFILRGRQGGVVTGQASSGWRQAARLFNQHAKKTGGTSTNGPTRPRSA